MQDETDVILWSWLEQEVLNDNNNNNNNNTTNDCSNMALSSSPGLTMDWATVLSNNVLDVICQHVTQHLSSMSILQDDTTEPLQMESFCATGMGEKDTLQFMTFLQSISHVTNIPCPMVVDSEVNHHNSVGDSDSSSSLLAAMFGDAQTARDILHFLRCASQINEYDIVSSAKKLSLLRQEEQRLYFTPPTVKPSPFETSIWSQSSIVIDVLSFLGDPVSVCYLKSVNTFCRRIVRENEHNIMKDVARKGGIHRYMRRQFWTWITLEKCQPRKWMLRPKTSRSLLHLSLEHEDSEEQYTNTQANNANKQQQQQQQLRRSKPPTVPTNFATLERIGRASKWSHIIQRDVVRSFGNLPPHKSNARLRADSIVRALITWGKTRFRRRGHTMSSGSSSRAMESRLEHPNLPDDEGYGGGGGGGLDNNDDDNDEEPFDTVSDWGGISQSFDSGSMLGDTDESSVKELALSGNTLSNDVKMVMQERLGKILHALAASHPEVGYCQGMDYIVAHLLRVLGGDMKDRQSKGFREEYGICKELPIEEVVYRVMKTLLTTYNLRHVSLFMYVVLCLNMSYDNFHIVGSHQSFFFHEMIFYLSADVYATTTMSQEMLSGI